MHLSVFNVCFRCSYEMIKIVCVCKSRYLLPCTHVMLSQRRAIRETDMYGKSADKFLSLIPVCCQMNAATSTEREEDNPFWSKGELQTERDK